MYVRGEAEFGSRSLFDDLIKVVRVPWPLFILSIPLVFYLVQVATMAIDRVPWGELPASQWREFALPGVVIAYLLAAYPFMRMLRGRAIETIRSISAMSEVEFEALRIRTLRLDRRGEILGLLAGVGFGLAVGRPWNTNFEFPAAVSWIIVSNTLMFGILGWLMYTAAESGVAMSRFFKAPVSVDLFRQGALMPIAQ